MVWQKSTHTHQFIKCLCTWIVLMCIFFLHYNIFYKFTIFDKYYRKLYKLEMNENKMGSFYPHAITINGWKKEYNLTGDH